MKIGDRVIFYGNPGVIKEIDRQYNTSTVYLIHYDNPVPFNIGTFTTKLSHDWALLEDLKPESTIIL